MNTYSSQKAGYARTTKKRKKKFRLIKYMLITFILLAALVMVAISPLCTVKRLGISGSVRYGSDEIFSAVGALKGINGFKNIGGSFEKILSLRYGNAEKMLAAKFPYLKRIEVRYVIPDKVRIYLSERKPEAIIMYAGTGIIIDNECHVLDTVVNADKYGLPVIKGLKFDRYDEGQAIKLKNPLNYSYFRKLEDALEESDNSSSYKLIKKINYIDVTNPSKVHIMINSRILVNFGGLQDLKYRIDFLKEIVAYKLKKDEKGLLDFTSGENPEFIPDNDY